MPKKQQNRRAKQVPGRSQNKRTTVVTRWKALQERVECCALCPRLVAHRESVAESKRAAYRDEDYWGKAVPDLGRPNCELLIVGLAPGAHGANRTGRLFTGDRSGDWLYRALHKAGYANQPQSTGRGDGLKLKNCAITNICRCVPPGNKPEPGELERCRPFLLETIELVNPQVYLALGHLAWKSVLGLAEHVVEFKSFKPRPKFSHLACVQLNDPNSPRPVWLIGSYHPSQQNTFTGRLTEKMFDQVFEKTRDLIAG